VVVSGEWDLTPRRPCLQSLPGTHNGSNAQPIACANDVADASAHDLANGPAIAGPHPLSFPSPYPRADGRPYPQPNGQPHHPSQSFSDYVPIHIAYDGSDGGDTRCTICRGNISADPPLDPTPLYSYGSSHPCLFHLRLRPVCQRPLRRTPPPGFPQV
jgi:hypothetical protein